MKSNPLRSNRDAPSRFLKNLKKIWTSRPDLTPRYDKASNKIVRGQIGTGCPSYNRFNAYSDDIRVCKTQPVEVKSGRLVQMVGKLLQF